MNFNLESLKKLDKKTIILIVAVVALVILMTLASTIKKTNKRTTSTTTQDTSIIKVSGTPQINNIVFSNIRIKKYSDTNFTITATIKNNSSKASSAFTIKIASSKGTATALVSALPGNSSGSFSTNVSIDLSKVKKAKAVAKELKIYFE